ncbi:hypothetical protein EV714DRAFT_187474, partial [Schizophyllum commune]
TPSSIARDVGGVKVDRPTELFLDRGVAFGAFPAIYWSIRDVHPVLAHIVESLMLPRLCKVLPLPVEFVQESRQYMTGYDFRRQCFIRDAPKLGYYPLFQVSPHVHQWYGYHEEKTLEQVIRSTLQLDKLCKLDDESRRVLVPALPDVLRLSDLAYRGYLYIRDPNEMESRHTWDAVIDRLLAGVFVAPSKGHLGYSLHNRNILFEVEKRRVEAAKTASQVGFHENNYVNLALLSWNNPTFKEYDYYKLNSSLVDEIPEALASTSGRPADDDDVHNDYEGSAGDSADSHESYEGHESYESDGSDDSDDSDDSDGSDDSDDSDDSDNSDDSDESVDSDDPLLAADDASPLLAGLLDDSADLSEPAQLAFTFEEPAAGDHGIASTAGVNSSSFLSASASAALQSAHPSPHEASDTKFVRQLEERSRTALHDHVKAIAKAVEAERGWRTARATLYQSQSNNMAALEARALCEFQYGVCDGVVFVEVPDVFTDDDARLATQLEEFAIVGAPELQRDRRDLDDDTEPAPDQPLPSSAPQIVRVVRDFAQMLRQRDRSAVDSSAAAAEKDETQVRGVPAAEDRDTPDESAGHTTAPNDEDTWEIHFSLNDRTCLASKSDMSKQSDDADRQEGATKTGKMNWKSMCMPGMFREYKRDFVKPAQGLNQGRAYIMSGTDYYASLDMYDVAVFALATVGAKGRLLCGWAERPPNVTDKDGIQIVHHIIDTNCPEWDLSNSSDAIDFAMFLTLLRTKHFPDIVRRFEEKRSQFVADWRSGNVERFRWTMLQQQKYSKAYQEAKARKVAQDKIWTEHQRQMDALRAQNAQKLKEKREREKREEEEKRKEKGKGKGKHK